MYSIYFQLKDISTNAQYVDGGEEWLFVFIGELDIHLNDLLQDDDPESQDVSHI